MSGSGLAKGEQNDMGQLLPNLINDSPVKLVENSKFTKFIRLNNDHYGTGTSVTPIRKGTFNERRWETSYNSGYNNRYVGCLLNNLHDDIWLLKLGEEIRGCLVLVPIMVAESNQVATLHTIYHKGLALSCTEAGVSGRQTEGKASGYFSDNTKCIVYLDETATAARWGLRSPYSPGGVVYGLNTGGIMGSSGAYHADSAPRPALNLKSSIVVPDSIDSDGCYTVESVPDNDGELYVKNNGLWVRVA